MDIKEIIYELNPHWEEGFFYEYKKKRNAFFKLKEDLNSSLITALYGPRRTGKSILVKQLIDYLLRKGVKREKILYFSFDLYRKDILEVVKSYREMFSHNFRKGRFYIFLDEMQKVENWSEELKHLYDNYENNIKLFITGSSSLKIKKGSENLAGRIKKIMLNVMSFEEYLKFKGIKVKTEGEFNKYLYRQLPYLVLNEENPSTYIKEIVKKYIYEDIAFEGVRNPSLMEDLFRIIARTPGQIIKLSDLSDDLSINRNTLSYYLSLLEENLLIRKLYNFSKSARKTEIKSKKYYPFYPNLCAYSPLFPELPLVYETHIANISNASYFYHKNGDEIDFIVGENLDTGIESKAKNVIKDKDIRTLIKNPLNLKKRIVVHKENSKILSREKNIKFIPIKDFNMQVI